MGPLRRGSRRTAPPPHEDFGPSDAFVTLTPSGLLERIATRSIRPATPYVGLALDGPLG